MNKTKHVNTKNLIKQPALCCIYCGKSYKTRMNLDKHIILCEIYYKAKKSSKTPTPTSSTASINEDDEDDIIPSQKTLYKIILELTLKCNKLENKVNEISKHITKKIQKINILDYLNSEKYKNNNNPQLLFENITEMITLEQSDIELLFHNSFMETMNHILSKTIFNNHYEQPEQSEAPEQSNQSNTVLPMIAFIQKTNTIYIYTNSNPTSNNQKPIWMIVTREKFIRFLNIIQFKMSKALSEWRKKNIQLLNDNDSQSILYDKTFSKLMDPEFKTESIYNKYYTNIYNKIKKDIKYIEYDVDF